MVFHQREVAVCGYSGSGKTTLITRLIDRLSARHAVGYVKHDAPYFQRDDVDAIAGYLTNILGLTGE